MDIKMVENIEKDDPSEDTLRLTKNDGTNKQSPEIIDIHRVSSKSIEGRTEKNRSRAVAETKQNNWQRVENDSKETQEETDTKREFYCVIEKIRNMQKRDEAGPISSKKKPTTSKTRTRTGDKTKRRNRNNVLGLG